MDSFDSVIVPGVSAHNRMACVPFLASQLGDVAVFDSPEFKPAIEFGAFNVTSHDPLLERSIWKRFENVEEVFPVPPFVTFALKVTTVLEARFPVFTLGTPEVKSSVPAVTVTVVLLFPVPPEPVQLTEYVVFDVGETATEPETAFPVEKLVPVQDVAFVADHVMVELLPDTILDGVAEIVATGAGRVTVIVFELLALPPAPEQVTV